MLASLKESEVEELSAEIARLGKLEPEVVGDVIDEFYAHGDDQARRRRRHGVRP